MPSKESLERAREWLKHDPQFAYCVEHSAEDEREEMANAVADLLDEAIRAEAEWWAKRSPRMLGTHWKGCEKEHAECARLAQLREGKT